LKKPLVTMFIIILILILVGGTAIGIVMYLKKSSKPHVVKPLSATQARKLQVDFPQMTTNLKDSGLIQFAITLQANDSKTKTELNDMQPAIQNVVNLKMKDFTPDQLKSSSGLANLESSLKVSINSILPEGNITEVYLSDEIVQ